MKTNADTITLAILHGSRATHEANENSDWDVAVLGDHALRADERSELGFGLTRPNSMRLRKKSISPTFGLTRPRFSVTKSPCVAGFSQAPEKRSGDFKLKPGKIS